MQIILLERIAKLGQMGDVVNVKDGYARNFLLPQGKALRANKANLKHFETQRAQLEARNLERKTEADGVLDKLNNENFTIIRQSGDTGQLYGSVSSRDIAALVSEQGFTINRNQVVLEQPIKMLGLHKVGVVLHPEVTADIIINVARTEDEASRQAAGEDVMANDGDGTAASDAKSDVAESDAETVFDEGVEAALEDDGETEAEEKAETAEPADTPEETEPAETAEAAEPEETKPKKKPKAKPKK